MRQVAWFAFALTVILGPLLATGFCQDDKADDTLATQPLVDVPSDVHVTPEMWMYLHEYRRHQDPKQSIREKAEFRANERQSRLASQNWYGHSKSRPMNNPIPYFGSYGAHWAGLPWDQNRWTAYKTTYRFYQNAEPEYDYYPALRLAGRQKR